MIINQYQLHLPKQLEKRASPIVLREGIIDILYLLVVIGQFVLSCPKISLSQIQIDPQYSRKHKHCKHKLIMGKINSVIFFGDSSICTTRTFDLGKDSNLLDLQQAAIWIVNIRKMQKEYMITRFNNLERYQRNRKIVCKATEHQEGQCEIEQNQQIEKKEMVLRVVQINNHKRYNLQRVIDPKDYRKLQNKQQDLGSITLNTLLLAQLADKLICKKVGHKFRQSLRKTAQLKGNVELPLIFMFMITLQTDRLQIVKILMNQDSQSSRNLNEEQKQTPTNLTPQATSFPTHASLIPSNSSLERPQSEENQPIREEVHIKSTKKGRRGGQELKNVNRGHWSVEQNKKYHWFLEIHYKHFVNRHMRRTDKIFKTMQIFIRTRQAEQCRSHHQKMEKKYLNFISIISNLREIHYATLDTTPMQKDIENNEIEFIDSLATIEQLKTAKKMENQEEVLPLKKTNSIKSAKQHKTLQIKEAVKSEQKMQLLQNLQQQKQRQMVDNGEPIMNMFEQSRLNVGELVMYHEKEDNSCIFHSMFHP